MGRFAFVTWEGLPHLSTDDKLAADELEARGHSIAPAIWTDPAVDWRGFDLVVLRSCWDYHKRFERFTAWLARMETLGVRVANSTASARWNAEKTYLRDLQQGGVRTVPSVWLRRGTPVSMDRLRAEVAALGVDAAELVLKPTVSATAWLTWRVSLDATALPEGFCAALAEHDFIVQPFIDEIVEGEWSLVFFGGTFSHAVIKRPREGDFRVQDEFGGRAELVRAPDALVSLAARILRCAPESSVYARVDGVETSAGFVLLELELVEPHLFLALAPGAPARFADALESAAGNWGRV